MRAGINLYLYAGPGDNAKNLLYSYNSEPYAYKIGDDLKQSLMLSHQEIKFVKEFKMADKNWFIVCRPTASFFATHKYISSWAIFICGIIITFLLTVYVFSILSRVQRIEIIVKERTLELNNLNEELKKVSRYNELILSSAGEGILGLDSQGKHSFLNPAAERMLGFDSEELIGKSSHQIWHYSKEDGSIYPKEECPIYMAFKDGKVHNARNEIFRRKDGTIFYVDYISTPIISDEKIIGAVVTFMDVTERRAAEEKIRLAAQEWERTFDSISDLVFIQDRTYVTEG